METIHLVKKFESWVKILLFYEHIISFSETCAFWQTCRCPKCSQD